MSSKGWTIVTWNGAGFDFDILAEESELQDECRRLTLGHVDMMFQVVCVKGFPIGLDAAARGMGLQGKSKQVQQHEVPQFWADGRTDEVLSYLAADVRATLDVALACEQRQELCWITQRGKTSRMPLNSGWLSVDRRRETPPAGYLMDVLADAACIVPGMDGQLTWRWDAFSRSWNCQHSPLCRT